MTLSNMDLSIIIVNWNSRDYLQRCLTSILVWTRDIKYEIVVIDSGSFDGCGEMLREHFPQVRFIQSDRNLGFAKANNAGYFESCGRNLLFLNPDIELVTPAVNIMFDYLHKLPKAGAVGCKLLNADKTVQTSCLQAFPTILNQCLDSEVMRTLLPKSPLWGNAALFNGQFRPEEVAVISGACIMMKRSIFERIGLFSDDYFMYAEDLDLCYKVRKAGYTNYYIPGAAAIHFGGGSTQRAKNGMSAVMMRESVWRFMRKTRGTVYGLAYRGSMLISAIGRLTVLTILFPFLSVWKSRESWNASYQKWMNILTWSMGLKEM